MTSPTQTGQPLTLAAILWDAGALLAAANISDASSSPEEALTAARECGSDRGRPCEECDTAIEILEAWMAGKAAAA